MTAMPVTSAELEQVFHNHGVNMRYLGQVAFQVSHYHMKLICFIEMIARTAKNILFDNVSSLIKQQSILMTSTHSIEDFSKELRVHLVDFMNLLFGDSEESTLFWNEVLCVRASLYYQLDLSYFREIDVKVNALYYAFLDLTGVREIKVLNYHARRQHKELIENSIIDRSTHQSYENLSECSADKNVKTPDFFFRNFFKKESPFGEKEKNWYKFEFGMRSKVFQMKFLPYQFKAEKFHYYLNDNRIEQAIKACHMKRMFKKITENGQEDMTSLLRLCQISLD